MSVQALLNESGGNYRSDAFGDVAKAAGIRLKRTHPLRPQTNGKAQRFIKTLQWEWAYVRPCATNRERLDALPIFLEEYNAHCHTQPSEDTLRSRRSVDNVRGNYN